MTPISRIADALAQEHLLPTARGSSAIWLLLKALDRQGSGVLVPANVCEVVIAVIENAGYRPVYLDVDPLIGNCRLGDFYAANTDDVSAVLAVHNYGAPLPIAEICDWSRARRMFVIEDVCNAIGATADDRPLGCFGDAAVYSFGMAKIVNVGGGGALATRDRALLKTCIELEQSLERWSNAHRARDQAFQACLRTIRQYPELKEPALYRALYQSYIPALAAAADPAQSERIAAGLDQLRDNLAARTDCADRYRAMLTDPTISHRPPLPGEVWWRYICHVPKTVRDTVVTELRAQNLPISHWYPAVDRLFGQRKHPLAGADAFEQTVLNLWVEPNADGEDVVERTCDALLRALDDRHTQ
ncbi:MAG: DegT/DnrJ/EryC1/StrS aminotransferase family protein [Deltaproteobacteria bacterium]|nr:DegT/DnrJ/EryC1/StrS aminotransferase family protein [Deltaproteobacteria bacterium]